jgi:hypothetical protein
MANYDWTAYEKIYTTMFGVKPRVYGVSALESYRNMLYDIKINHNNDANMAKKLNDMVKPYADSIKADPYKVLTP